ncbi:MAG: InlB B-repeat-containing protein [Stomatobaculum sp.]
MNLKLSSVLFSTEHGASKSAFSETVAPAASDRKWVLTLDSGMTGFAATRTNPTEVITAAAGGDIELTLSNSMAGADQISGMLLDGNQTVLRYGKIADTADSTATITIPAGLTEGAEYTLRVFSEEAHEDRTSYAGNTVDISFTVGSGAATHTVRFDLNGHGSGSIPDQTVADGAAVPNPVNPTDANYDFGGWYKEAACATEWNFASNTVSGDMTLYAKWTSKAVLPAGTYRIHFDANGGTVSPAEMLTGTDGKLSSLPVPARSGYAFVGWFTVASGGTEIKTDTVFAADKTVYAHWNKVSGGSSGGSGGSGGGGGGGSRRSAGSTAGTGGTPGSVSGSWRQDGKGWWFAYSAGGYPKNAWKQLPYSGGTAWYAFDEAGYLRTGWFFSGGHWYYLSGANDATLGKLVTGWAEIGGKWYYLEPTGNVAHPQGAMYANEKKKTPDGYTVDEGGVWVK